MSAQKQQPKKAQQKKVASVASKVVSAPVARALVVSTPKPSVTHSRNGDCRIVHREYVRDVSGSVAFNDSTFWINPGRAIIFPWLSAIAVNYESYRFNNLKFHFETESSTTSTGSVILAIDYDANDASAASKMQLMSYRGAVRTAPWQRCTYTALAEELNKRKSYFVTTALSPVNSAGHFADRNLYDVGAFTIATQGQATTANIGELYVEYDITFMTPQMSSVSVGQSLGGMWTGNTNAAPFASADSRNNIRVAVTSTGTTTSVTTVTFFTEMNCVITVSFGGTALVGPFTISGTASSIPIWPIIGFATQVAGSFDVTASAGQTWIITEGNSTITQGILAIAQWPVMV